MAEELSWESVHKTWDRVEETFDRLERQMKRREARANMGTFDVERTISRAKLAKDSLDSLTNLYRGALANIQADRDPSHASDEYKAYARKELFERHMPGIKATVSSAVQESKRAREESAEHLKRQQHDYERSFDYARMSFLKGEFSARIQAGGIKTADRLRSEVEASGSQDSRRAFRSALMEEAERQSKSSQEANRMWAAQQVRGVQEWAAADEPEELRAARTMADEWSKSDEELRGSVAKLGEELRPRGFMERGLFDEELGIEPASQVVMHEKGMQFSGEM